MNPGSLLDAATAAALQFDWLRAAVAPAGDYGARAFENARPFAPGEEAAAAERAASVERLASELGLERLDVVRDVLRSTPDAIPAIARAAIGDALNDAQFLELMRFCDAVARTDALLEPAASVGRANTAGTSATATALERGRSGKFGFYLADGFDTALASARAVLARQQAEYDAARGRLVQRIAGALGRDDVSGDEFIVMRDALAGPLPAGVRVVREAPTYLLCAVEYDESTLAALQRRDAAADAVAEAERHVRVQLSSAVREHAVDLEASATALGAIDVAVSAARFCAQYDCRVARIAGEPRIAFREGRFLPLALELERDGRAFTPIDVALDDVASLTGPNMGGKSVCLRTCGLVAVAAAFGLPVPARDATAALFDEIAWLGIGSDDDRPGSLLSSFAREIVRVRDVLERPWQRMLVLVDEFARTTTPQEGKALLVALIARLRDRGACGLAATHLAGIAEAAGVRHFAVRGLRGIPERPQGGDLAQALGLLAASMDYRIAEVTGGVEARSDAIALAELLGLDGELVAAAYAALEAPGTA